MDGHLGMAEIAKLLGVSRPRVWQLRKRPDFPAPAGNDGGRDYWYDTTILRWAAGAGRELARRAPLLYRPVSGVHPARYLGAWEVGGYVVVTFDAELGRVCLGYPRIDQYTQPVTGLVAAVDAEVVVRVESHWDARGRSGRAKPVVSAGLGRPRQGARHAGAVVAGGTAPTGGDAAVAPR